MPAVGARPLPALGFAAALLAFGLLAACQDPSGVGLGLIGEEGNDPNGVVVVADSVFLTEEDELTGGFADGALPAQARVLVGAVMDPAFGDATAEAYLDVRPPNTPPSGFTGRTITSATLRLVRDYAYGDTTATLDLALYDLQDGFNPVGAPADTAFAAGGLIETYAIPAADSLFALALPDAWVADNDRTLRSDSVLTAFDGFKLRLADGAAGGAVVGFDVLRSRLRLTTEQDTVDYLIREVFTHVTRGDAAAPAGEVAVLRDGASEALAVTIPFDEVAEAAVARAVLRLAADASLLDEGMLARALPDELILIGVTESGGRVLLAAAERDAATDTYAFASRTLTRAIQDAVLGRPPFTRYLVAPAQSPASLNVLPVVVSAVPGEDERRPRFVLTVIPATN